jgi:putative flippase GtrA
MRTKDITTSIVIGLFTALVWLSVLNRFNETIKNYGWTLFLVVPLIFIFGLYLGKWLSAWKPFFNQFAKFVMVGFLNAGIDFAIFNFLIHYTGIEQGHQLSLFKSISFMVALVNSYLWNKFWVFSDSANKQKDAGKEFVSYLIVTLIGFGLNVGITSLIANSVAPQFGISQLGWDNVAAMIATLANLVWNFSGYRLIVFAQKKTHANA